MAVRVTLEVKGDGFGQRLIERLSAPSFSELVKICQGSAEEDWVTEVVCKYLCVGKIQEKLTYGSYPGFQPNNVSTSRSLSPGRGFRQVVGV